MRQITTQRLLEFELYLRGEERSPGTIEKYIRDLRLFQAWIEDREVSRECTVRWKTHLQNEGVRFRNDQFYAGVFERIFSVRGLAGV